MFLWCSGLASSACLILLSIGVVMVITYKKVWEIDVIYIELRFFILNYLQSKLISAMEDKCNVELITATRPKCAKQCWKALFLGNTRRRTVLRVRRVRFWERTTFCCFSLTGLGKSSTFQYKPIWKYADKYKNLHSKIIIKKERFKRKTCARKLNEWWSEQPLRKGMPS